MQPNSELKNIVMYTRVMCLHVQQFPNETIVKMKVKKLIYLRQRINIETASQLNKDERTTTTNFFVPNLINEFQFQ